MSTKTNGTSRSVLGKLPNKYLAIRSLQNLLINGRRIEERRVYLVGGMEEGRSAKEGIRVS